MSPCSAPPTRSASTTPRAGSETTRFITIGTTVLASMSWMTSNTASTRIGYAGLIVNPSSTAGITPTIPPTIGTAAVSPAKMPRMTGSGRPRIQHARPTTSSDRNAVDGHSPKETTHAEPHLAKDVDDEVVMGIGEEVDGERLEAVAAHQPQEADHEHEHEVDDDAEDRSADREEDLLGGADEAAHLLAHVDIEMELLLQLGEPVQEVALVRREVRGERLGLADDRLHQEHHHHGDERQQRHVHDQDSHRGRDAPAAQLGHHGADALGEHDRHEHHEDDADDAGEECHERDHAEDDQRGGHERANRDDRSHLAMREPRCLLGPIGSRPGVRLSRLGRRDFV